MTSTPRAPGRVLDAPTFAPGERFLTVGTVARYFEVTEVTIKNWVDAGQLLAARTVGGHRRIASSSVARLLEEQSRPVPASLAQRKPLVMLVEGDSSWSRAIRRGLSGRLRVEAEVDPWLALLSIARLQPDVIVVDLQLPGGEARKLASAVRSDAQTRLHALVLSGANAGDAKGVAGLLGPASKTAGEVAFLRRGDPAAFVEAVILRAERPSTKTPRRG